MPTLDRIGKTIVGPNEHAHVGAAKLLELQDLKWGRLKSQEQSHFLRAAKFIQALFDQEVDGWVVTSGDDTRARYWDNASEYVGNDGPAWTTDLDKALWFARRADAERFAEDDEDAWHIRRVSDVRRMWGLVPGSMGVPATSTGAPHTSPVPDATYTGPRPPPLPHPAPVPVDQRSAEHLLYLFRGFVNRNVTQWVLGAGDHHHPIWQDLAQELDQFDLNYYPTSGADWAYIQGENRTPHAVLLDQANAHEAEQRGG